MKNQDSETKLLENMAALARPVSCYRSTDIHPTGGTREMNRRERERDLRVQAPMRRGRSAVGKKARRKHHPHRSARAAHTYFARFLC